MNNYKEISRRLLGKIEYIEYSRYQSPVGLLYVREKANLSIQCIGCFSELFFQDGDQTVVCKRCNSENQIYQYETGGIMPKPDVDWE